MEVDRRTAAVLLVGTIGILALVLSAATLTDPTDAEADSGWVDIGFDEESQGELIDWTFDVPIVGPALDTLWTAFAIGALLLSLFVLVVYDRETLLRWLFVIAGSLLVFALLNVILSHTSMADVDLLMNRTQGNETGITTETGESPTPGGGGLPIYVLGAGVLAALLAVVAIVYQTGDEPADEPEPEDERGLDEQLQAVGEAAGRAARGIAADETVSSNAVYRAWVEMTEALDVANRASTTPGEFAEVAIEAGMDPDDVRELTRLFEDVRYGDEPVSEARAERAEAALRRIEAAYAGEER